MERREIAGSGGRERVLDDVVAGDVDRVHLVHSIGQLAAFFGVHWEKLAPGGCPRVECARIREERSHRRIIPARRVGEAAEEERVVHPLLLEQGRNAVADRGGVEGIDERVDASAGESELGAHAQAPGREIALGEALERLRGERYGALAVLVDQRQQRFREPRQVPLQDARLVAIRITPTLVDRAEDGCSVVANGP